MFNLNKIKCYIYNYLFILILLHFSVFTCQQDQGDSLIRSTNTVDIQVCASSILSNSRDLLQVTINENLKAILQTSAIYLTRTYTTDLGTICFLYVYQSTSPQSARDSVPILVQNNGILSMTFQSRTVQCAVSAVPWQGEGSGPLGPGLPWQWTGTDAILWGGSIAGILLTCIIGICCYVRIVSSREHERVEKLLMRDRELIRELIPKIHPKDIKKLKLPIGIIVPNNNNSKVSSEKIHIEAEKNIKK